MQSQTRITHTTDIMASRRCPYSTRSWSPYSPKQVSCTYTPAAFNGRFHDSTALTMILVAYQPGIDGSTLVFRTSSIWRIFVVHYNGRLWEILIFLHLFLNELLKSLLLFNNQLVLMSLHHI